MPLPTPDRLSHHEAGHAIVQHWVAKGRYRVTRVSLESNGGQVAGSSLIDRDVTLGLYEFGLVMLAGIAAENRYFSEYPPPAGETWGAVGDIDAWLATAREVLQSEPRVDMVTRNVMKRLKDYFEDAENWGAVRNLAGQLLVEGYVDGELLSAILERTSASP
jgi:hypothetical protein